VVDLGWFVLKYHRAVESGFWYVTRKVDDGQKVATSEGFLTLSNYLQIADESHVFDCCLQFIECILTVDYRGQDYHKALWNVMQHFALYPNRNLVPAHGAAEWINTSKRRLAMAEKYLPVTHGNVEAFVAVLQGREMPGKADPKPVEKAIVELMQGRTDGVSRMNIWLGLHPRFEKKVVDAGINRLVNRQTLEKKGSGDVAMFYIANYPAVAPAAVKPLIVPPAPKPAQEIKEKDMVALLAKRILRAIKEGCEDDREKLYAYCNRWGMWPGYGRDLNLAMKQLAKKGKLKPIKTLSLTHRVIQFLGNNEFTPMEIAVGLAIEKDKFNSIRSTINILLLKGELGRRIVPGKDGYSYARSAYYKENGIAYLNK